METDNPEHRAVSSAKDELAEQLARRLSLWVAVGNGLGVVAVGNTILDEANIKVAHLLLPAGWSFALGLVLAAVFNGLLGLQHRAFARYWRSADPAVEAHEHRFATALTPWVAGTFLLAAIGFIFGLFYPLAAFSLRFLQ
jgi:hypothetical protein